MQSADGETLVKLDRFYPKKSDPFDYVRPFFCYLCQETTSLKRPSATTGLSVTLGDRNISRRDPNTSFFDRVCSQSNLHSVRYNPFSSFPPLTLSDITVAPAYSIVLAAPSHRQIELAPP